MKYGAPPTILRRVSNPTRATKRSLHFREVGEPQVSELHQNHRGQTAVLCPAEPLTHDGRLGPKICIFNMFPREAKADGP